MMLKQLKPSLLLALLFTVSLFNLPSSFADDWKPLDGGKWRIETDCQTYAKGDCDKQSSRRWRVFLPANYHQQQALPLIFDFHGTSLTIEKHLPFTGFEAAARTKGFIVVIPQAVVQPFRVTKDRVGEYTTWNADLNQSAKYTDDVAFINKLYGYLVNSYKVDKSRIFATGMSGGARMVSRLLCQSQIKFRAVAPVAGLQFPQSSEAVPACKPKYRVPILTFHGLADTRNDYNRGGTFPTWRKGVEQAMKLWAAHYGCEKRPSVVVVAQSHYTTIEYQQCLDNASIKLYAIEQLEHKWPTEPHASSLIVEYFAQF